MTLAGIVQDGKIILDDRPDLPDGTRVKVTVEPEDAAPRTAKELLQRFAGCMSDLPADLARNHDHYIHGTPKR